VNPLPPARPASSSPPGDRPGIPLETEPFVFFHPLVAGQAAPGQVQPVPGIPLLEEEPSAWPELPESPPVS
jgi:hypothetical protein